LANLRGVLTVLTLKPLFGQVANTEEPAKLANVDSVAIADIEESLFQEPGCSMRDHAVALHFSKAQASISRSSFCGLASENLGWSSASSMDLVLNHVLESLVVSGSKEDLDFHLFSVKTIVHHFVTPKLVSLFVKKFGHLLNSVLMRSAYSLKGCRVSFNSCESTHF
jgi:hypothetical protein